MPSIPRVDEACVVTIAKIIDTLASFIVILGHGGMTISDDKVMIKIVIVIAKPPG